MDNYQSCLRPRSSTVLDLPDELLLQVFSLINPFDPSTDHDVQTIISTGSRDIQNARLTCRRFCATSSRFLINSIAVSLERDSLLRLKNISEHPTIRIGVRRVLFHMISYIPEIAERPGEFIFLCSWELQRLMHSMRDDAELYQHLECIHLVWDNLTGSGESNIPGCSVTEALAEIFRAYYEKYRARCKDQMDLFRDRKPIETIATSLAQMPSADTLAFCDDGYRRPDHILSPIKPFSTTLEIVETLLRPLYIRRYKYDGVLDCQVAVDFITDLLGALHPAGFILKHLKIRLEGVIKPTRKISEQAHTNLVLLAQRLESIYLHLGRSPPSLNRDGYQLMEEHMWQLLSSILNSGSVKVIDIRFSDGFRNSPNSPSFGPVLYCGKRAKLTELRLQNVCFHEYELREMASSFETGHNHTPCCAHHPGVIINLLHTGLLSGSWMGVVDALDDKVSIGTSLSPLSTGLDENRKLLYPTFSFSKKQYDDGWCMECSSIKYRGPVKCGCGNVY